MRLAAERGEQHEHLGESTIEGSGLGRPPDRGKPVPEGFRIDRIVKHDPIAQVANLPRGHGMDPRFVHDEAPHRGRIDGRHGSHTIAARNPARRAARTLP
jgi:hypothetical protein